MPHSIQDSVASQVETLQRQFAQTPGLPFAELLPAPWVTQLLQEQDAVFYDRIYTPLVTLATFLSQCQDADPSQRQAVARLIAYRIAQEQPACSSHTGAYSKARQRLPEKVLAELTRYTGKHLMTRASADWSWRGRCVKIVDGSTASMPDTEANQQAYPQMACQKPGVGFPILRFVVIFSLAVGSVLDAAFCPYQGKQTSELALFRRLHESIDAGDVVLGDRHFCSFFEIADLKRRGADVVLRQHQCRITDFRRGVQLGRYDHRVVWKKPARPDWMDEESYRQFPDELAMREVRIHIKGKGRKARTRTLTIATTLTAPQEVGKGDLAELYRRRWQAELHLRSLKTVLQMDVLRCKTPEMVRKEIWAHLLAYNLIRKVMAQAAQEYQVEPWKISFKATLQTLKAFALPLRTCTKSKLPEVIEEMLRAIARHSVGNRPDRIEPRALKRRPKPYDLLNKPRPQARKLELAK